MGKVVVKEKNGQVVITNKLLKTETINELVCQLITSGTVGGILPVAVQRNGKKASIVCSVEGMITLDQWNRLVTKRMFLDLVMSVIAIVRNCESNAINPNNLDLKSDRLFMEPVSQKFWLLYWPVANNQHSDLPQHFFERLPSELNFALNEEMDFIDEYKAFFDSHIPFSMNGFENLILKLQGKARKKGLVVPSGNHHDTSLDMPEEDSDESVEVEYNPFDTIKSEVTTESMGLFGQGVNETSSGNSGSNDDGIWFPILVRKDTNEFFAVNKSVFRIGSKSDCSDLSIDSKYISKHHADIVSKSGRYYIIDRNSTNKTYLNGHKIPHNLEVEIASGSKIRFADKDFVFWIPRV